MIFKTEKAASRFPAPLVQTAKKLSARRNSACITAILPDDFGVNCTTCVVMRVSKSLCSGVLLPIVFAACASVPDAPVRPETPSMSGEFANGDALSFSSEAVEMDWWRLFEDPVLSDLVDQALEENKDLSVAEANIEAARTILARQGLLRTPSTSASAAGELGRAARDDADVEVTGNAQLAASWEYDAFGRLTALIDSASFQVEQVEELQRDVAVTIAADTALAYVDYRGNQVRLDVAQSNADLQGESVELLRVLFDNGRATRLDLERAESQYRTTLASLPLLELNIQTAATRLATLTGQTNIAVVSDRLAASTGRALIPEPPETLTLGTPTDLIRRRPDIRAAEADIARLLALGDAERARLFPTLTFNANILALFTEDSELDNSFGFGIGPAVRWEGPDLRRVRADIDIADAQTRVAFAAYERAVVEALGEIEIALIGYSQERSRRTDLEAAASSAARALDLAQLRFDEGLDDFLDVIDAQRTLLDAQDRLEISRLATTRQAIITYRALGGIWLDAASTDPGVEGE
ncbi:MAG: TolC family protein [Pseudomonadota bacterium]